jgi:hypothetical protein
LRWIFPLNLGFDNLHCIIPTDPSGEDEPYLWVFRIKLDGSSLRQRLDDRGVSLRLFSRVPCEFLSVPRAGIRRTDQPRRVPGRVVLIAGAAVVAGLSRSCQSAADNSDFRERCLANFVGRTERAL